MKFDVGISEVRFGSITVSAETKEEALKIAEQRVIGMSEAQFDKLINAFSPLEFSIDDMYEEED